MPADPAMEDAITENNAAQVQAEVVVEAANAPVTPEAHDSMTGRDITIISWLTLEVSRSVTLNGPRTSSSLVGNSTGSITNWSA